MNNLDASRRAAGAIREFSTELADLLVAREFERHPELEARYGPTGRDKSREDAAYHLAYLAQAVSLASPALYTDYLGWVKVVLAQRKVDPADLAFHLDCLRDVLLERLSAETHAAILEVLEPALAALPTLPTEVPSFIEPEAPLAPLAHQYLQALLRGDRQTAQQLVHEAVEGGTSVRDLYLHLFQRTQREIGRLWQTNQVNVAHEHYCTAATQLIMSQLYPRIFAHGRSGGTLVATCVAGDLHELGIRMIADFFEMAGWDTYYLGANTPTDSVVETVMARRADVLAISATIAYHLPQVEGLIQRIRSTPKLAATKILVGGYPFNAMPELWRTVGADGHVVDAEGVVALAERLTGRRVA